MLHGPARRAIAHILRGNGFGPTAQAITAAARIQDWAACPAPLRERLFAATGRLIPDAAPPHHTPALQARAPIGAAELVAALADELTEHACDPGAAWASLAAVADLWPHASEEERGLLRARLVSGIAALPPRGGGTTTAELRAWTRDLATEAGAPAHTALDLLRLADDPTPHQAFLRLARHQVHPNRLPHLLGVLGGLACQRLETAADHQGVLWSVCVGAAACGSLAGRMQPEHLAIAATQLGLQFWWGARHGDRAPASDRFGSPDLATSVQAGDRAAARRAARALAQRPERFWAALWPLLDSPAGDDPALCLRLAPLLHTASLRAANAVCPDDAAAIATLLATSQKSCIVSS